MDKPNDTKPKKKGLFSVLKESMAKTSEGCGPGCGCHAENAKEKANSSEAAKDSKRQ